MRRSSVLVCLLALAPAGVVAACGSRTGLLVPDLAVTAPADAGVDAFVEIADATTIDALIVPDASDARSLDVVPPGIDARPAPEAGIKCADGAVAAHAYLVSQRSGFYRFDPPSLQSTFRGTLPCPGAAASAPFTMTVTETDAYVVYNDNTLYRVDLASLTCHRTAFNPAQINLSGLFGLGSAYSGGKEWLYVYGCTPTPTPTGNVCVPTLARADLGTLTLQVVGPIAPLPAAMNFPVDMKADGFGRLFAIDFPGNLVEIDSATAHVVGYDTTGFNVAVAEALLTWNGELFLFGDQSGTIARYDLVSRKLFSLGQVGDAIVGAGSAPCVH